MSSIFWLRWLTLLSVLFWFLVYWQGGCRAVADIRRSGQAHVSRVDALLMGAIAAASLLMVCTSVFVGAGLLDAGWEPPLVMIAGGACATWAGIAGTFYCRRYLGRFWTAETALQPDHQVVDSGPYRVVRHPIYTSAIVLYLGLALTFPTWWNGLAAAAVAVAYALKAGDEDRFLRRKLPGYADYARRVPARLVPGVW